MTVRILTGDVRERLADLPDGSVQCCVTSPPYFGLRDYGTAGQIGLEPTLAEYVQTMVDVFREVRRVLRDDGTVWLNLGDSYAGGGRGGHSDGIQGTPPQGLANDYPRSSRELKPKDLMMVPARVAIALCDDGWWLRSDIIWAKKNCMPESVTDRPTSSHEHIFLLTKNARYFYDAEAVREANTEGTIQRLSAGPVMAIGGHGKNAMCRGDGGRDNYAEATGRNQRNVWHLATEPTPLFHFATFPTEIPRRCIKAGTSEKGQCPACGAPWVRVVEKPQPPAEIRNRNGAKMDFHSRQVGSGQKLQDWYDEHPAQTTGWSPSCTCNDPGEPVPQTVLDPFAGAGTTLLVADQLGRHGIGIELNPEYAEMARKRIYNDAPMLVRLVAD